MAEKIQPFHVRLTEYDRECIEVIRQCYGCISDAAAIRHALIVASGRSFTQKKSRKKLSQGA